MEYRNEPAFTVADTIRDILHETLTKVRDDSGEIAECLDLFSNGPKWEFLATTFCGGDYQTARRFVDGSNVRGPYTWGTPAEFVKRLMAAFAASHYSYSTAEKLLEFARESAKMLPAK